MQNFMFKSISNILNEYILYTYCI